VLANLIKVVLICLSSDDIDCHVHVDAGVSLLVRVHVVGENLIIRDLVKPKLEFFENWLFVELAVLHDRLSKLGSLDKILGLEIKLLLKLHNLDLLIGLCSNHLA